jgi:predicted nucleic acid-binding protein
MKVLIDTNIVLDLLLDRSPHSEYAAKLFALVETGEVTGYVCATAVTTVHYLACKDSGKRKAKSHLSKLLSLVEIAPVGRAVLESAMKSKISDYEDAVVCEAALLVDADAVITRDRKHFKNAPLPVYSSQEIVKLLSIRDS